MVVRKKSDPTNITFVNAFNEDFPCFVEDLKVN